jgi:predicted ATP-dependent protease
MDAEAGLLGFDEAAFCSTVFMKIKLSFVPDIDLDTFNSLEPAEKSAINRLGYRLYLDWKEANADEFDALLAEVRASQVDS